MASTFKDTYQKKIRPQLKKELKLSSIEAVPKIEKITINTSSSDFKSDKDFLTKTKEWLTVITGQKPQETKARLSVAGFNIREGDVIGLKSTLHGDKMYDFCQKLIDLVLPRLKDFQGVSRDHFDNQGNYTLGFHEQIIFPEIEYDKIGRIQGLEVTITTSTSDPKQAFALLQALGMPFAKEEETQTK